MPDKKPTLDYQSVTAAATPRRVWGLSCFPWVMVALLCGVADFGGWLATNGRVDGWPDVLFTVGLAAAGVVALLNAVRSVAR